MNRLEHVSSVEAFIDARRALDGSLPVHRTRAGSYHTVIALPSSLHPTLNLASVLLGASGRRLRALKAHHDCSMHVAHRDDREMICAYSDADDARIMLHAGAPFVVELSSPSEITVRAIIELIASVMRDPSAYDKKCSHDEKWVRDMKMSSHASGRTDSNSSWRSREVASPHFDAPISRSALGSRYSSLYDDSFPKAYTRRASLVFTNDSSDHVHVGDSLRSTLLDVKESNIQNTISTCSADDTIATRCVPQTRMSSPVFTVSPLDIGTASVSTVSTIVICKICGWRPTAKSINARFCPRDGCPL